MNGIGLDMSVEREREREREPEPDQARTPDRCGTRAPALTAPAK
ncbi:hypothetical protein ACWEWX_34175 [Streptomyces asiaticus]